MRLYLNVPYAEKEEAKRLGAKWDTRVKKWYTDAPRSEYVRFAKWLLRDTDDVVIAAEYLYLIEGMQTCWKCGQKTVVVGLGIGEHVHVFGEPDDPQIEVLEDDDVHLAWAEREDDIPPQLLRYMKAHYPVRVGYSKTLGRESFANHCACCGALQGNWFLFHEPDSPLAADVSGQELVDRMRALKIRGIPIESDLPLAWEMGYGSNDFAYMEFGQFEQLTLSSDPNNEYITYEELYCPDAEKSF